VRLPVDMALTTTVLLLTYVNSNLPLYLQIVHHRRTIMYALLLCCDPEAQAQSCSRVHDTALLTGCCITHHC